MFMCNFLLLLFEKRLEFKIRGDRLVFLAAPNVVMRAGYTLPMITLKVGLEGVWHTHSMYTYTIKHKHTILSQ